MVPILLACNGGYAMQLATTLRSAVEANQASWPLDITVMVVNFSLAMRDKVHCSLPAGSASIRWIEADLSAFRDYASNVTDTKINYARLLVEDAFPHAKRVLYLDSDLLVLGDLCGLANANLGANVVGAVIDDLDPYIQSDHPDYRRLPKVARYFNDGVLLINLNNWRRQRTLERALDYLKKNPNPRHSDQDAINVACDCNWTALDRQWNYIEMGQHTDFGRMAPDLRPAILHFAVWNKPWNYNYVNVNAELYDEFRSRTRFARTPISRLQDRLRRGVRMMKDFLSGYAPVRATWDYIRG